jgi:hypothetical protein
MEQAEIPSRTAPLEERGSSVNTDGTPHCTICGTPAQHAVCGNRLLFHTDVARLPTDHAPTVFWRCEAHRRYQLRHASAVQANPLGDLIYSLTCGHEVVSVFRGPWGYTPAKIYRGMLTGRIRLNQPQRCYRCGDREQKSKGLP